MQHTSEEESINISRAFLHHCICTLTHASTRLNANKARDKRGQVKGQVQLLTWKSSGLWTLDSHMSWWS